MKLVVRKTTTVIAALATAGVSSIFMGATPAFAASAECGATGALIAPGVCEQTFTAGTTTFMPTADMTQLEVLLVGAGGAGADQNSNQGYSAPGGGGEVKIVDFSGATDPLTVTVPAAGAPGSVTDGTTTGSVNNGADAAINDQVGGTSGSGYLGGVGSGGGAAANPILTQDGGAGVVVSTIAPLTPVPSLFSTDSNCYGGGGAGISSTRMGTPGCGGGGPTDASGTALLAPTANSGGGGGGLMVSQTPLQRAGADGRVVIRWTATSFTLAFNMLGHGTAATAQSIPYGTAPVQPSDPAETGYTFNGWFTDAGLTTPANFATPVTGNTTYYASWTPVNYAVAFEMNGHGTAPANQMVSYGTPPVQPSDPTATGYTFDDWFTDAGLTTPANFATPVTGNTTYYASWTPVAVAPAATVRALATTGSAPNPSAIPLGLAILMAGAALFTADFRRKRKNG